MPTEDVTAKEERGFPHLAPDGVEHAVAADLHDAQPDVVHCSAVGSRGGEGHGSSEVGVPVSGAGVAEEVVGLVLVRGHQVLGRSGCVC